MEECVTPDEEEDQKRIIREMKDRLQWDEEEDERRLKGLLEEEKMQDSLTD